MAGDSSFRRGETIEMETEPFAYQHGKLTYHELTLKDRFQNVEGQFPKKVEELTVRTFKREYWCEELPQDLLNEPLFPGQKYQWTVKQSNSKPHEIEI